MARPLVYFCVFGPQWKKFEHPWISLSNSRLNRRSWASENSCHTFSYFFGFAKLMPLTCIGSSRKSSSEMKEKRSKKFDNESPVSEKHPDRMVFFIA